MARGRLIADTNAVIAYWGGNQSVIIIIENAEALYLPVVVLGELLYGALNSSQPDHNRELVLQFLDYIALFYLSTRGLHLRTLRSELNSREKANQSQRMISGLQQHVSN